ncbi:MAG: HNH endonuclease signature motif containing protein, partial [Bacteroidota bacterium]
CCEYCGYPESLAYYAHHIDHIISEKHGGPTHENNLALACRTCNLKKGSDIATLIDTDPPVVRLYHPRFDRWSKHFVLVNASIQPLTRIGYGTALLLQFNEEKRLYERELLVEQGLWLAPGNK